MVGVGEVAGLEARRPRFVALHRGGAGSGCLTCKALWWGTRQAGARGLTW
jgi:hypothetical protein